MCYYVRQISWRGDIMNDDKILELLLTLIEDMSFVKTKKAIDAKKAEEQYSDLQQFNISETAKICKNGLRIVKIANVPVGIAYSDEDEKKLLETLHHYGQNLLTVNDVMTAMQKMQDSIIRAEDLNEAGMVPEQELTIDGKTVFLIDGNLYDADGNQIND